MTNILDLSLHDWRSSKRSEQGYIILDVLTVETHRNIKIKQEDTYTKTKQTIILSVTTVA